MPENKKAPAANQGHNNKKSCANSSKSIAQPANKSSLLRRIADKARSTLIKKYTAQSVNHNFLGSNILLSTLIRLFFFRDGSPVVKPRFLQICHHQIIQAIPLSPLGKQLKARWYQHGKPTASYYRALGTITARKVQFSEDRPAQDPAGKCFTRFQPAGEIEGDWQRNIYELTEEARALLEKTIGDPEEITRLFGGGAGRAERTRQGRDRKYEREPAWLPGAMNDPEKEAVPQPAPAPKPKKAPPAPWVDPDPEFTASLLNPPPEPPIKIVPICPQTAPKKPAPSPALPLSIPVENGLFFEGSEYQNCDSTPLAFSSLEEEIIKRENPLTPTVFNKGISTPHPTQKTRLPMTPTNTDPPGKLPGVDCSPHLYNPLTGQYSPDQPKIPIPSWVDKSRRPCQPDPAPCPEDDPIVQQIKAVGAGGAIQNAALSLLEKVRKNRLTKG